MNWPPFERASVEATDTLTPNSYCRCALPLPMHGAGFAGALTFQLTGRLRSCIRPLAQPHSTAGLDGFRKLDSLSQNLTQRCAARIGIGRARFPTVCHHVVVLRKSKLFELLSRKARQFGYTIRGE
jgi:hypothetical protein